MKDKIQPDDERAVSLYQSLLGKYGENYRALDWGSRESQVKRFEVLADVGMTAGDHVLDVGCGLADFHEWLNVNKPGIKYSGIDFTPEMAQKAQDRFPDIEIKNKSVSDLDVASEKYQYLVASGIFFLRRENPRDYMENTIFRMFSLSEKGIAFNSLSYWAENKVDDEFYAVPTDVLNYCRKLTPFVTLRHDYHPGDFTVYMYKNNSDYLREI